MVKYHTDEEITMRCLEYRGYPMSVVQQMLKVEPKKNIINGVLNVTPDGIQPPKSIMAMATALSYENSGIDSKVYSAGEVSRIRNKLTPEQIMENTNIRGAMIPDRLYKSTKEHAVREIPNLVMSGEDYKNPGEKGYTLNVGLNTMTSLSQPSLFESSGTGSAISDPIEMSDFKPQLRATPKRKGMIWDSNRGQLVIDTYAFPHVEGSDKPSMLMPNMRGTATAQEKAEEEKRIQAAMAPAATNY